jgi:hypothetical protein
MSTGDPLFTGILWAGAILLGLAIFVAICDRISWIGERTTAIHGWARGWWLAARWQVRKDRARRALAAKVAEADERWRELKQMFPECAHDWDDDE